MRPVTVCVNHQPSQRLHNPNHLGGNQGANLKSISHRCYRREVAFGWELTEETIYLSLDWLQGGPRPPNPFSGKMSKAMIEAKNAEFTGSFFCRFFSCIVSSDPIPPAVERMWHT